MSANFWKVFRHELLHFGRRRGYLFMTFGVPLIALVILVGYRALNDPNRPDEAQDDNDRGFVTDIQQAGYIDLSGLFTVPPPNSPLIRFADTAAADDALLKGEIQVYYIIAADYLDTGDVTLVLPRLAFNRLSSQMIEQLIFETLAPGLAPGDLARLRTPTVQIQDIVLARDGSTDGRARDFMTDFWAVYFFSIAFLLGVFTTNGYLLQGVIHEKENRLIEILVSSVRPLDLLGGKILAMGLLGMAQIVVWLAALVGLVELAALLGLTNTILSALRVTPEVLVAMVLYFIVGYLFFAAVYGGISAISNSMQEGPQYAVIFTLPAAVPFYFTSVFAETPNAALPVFLSIFPLTAPVAMIQRLVLSTVPFIEVALSLGLMALSTLALMWFAARLFRVQTLLAGQVPKPKDLLKLLRG